MLRYFHLKKIIPLIVCLLVLMLFSTAGAVEIVTHTVQETIDEFIRNPKYTYDGCHSCTGTTMLVSSYMHGIGWNEGDHRYREEKHPKYRDIWYQVAVFEGGTEAEIKQWIFDHAKPGDVLTNGFGNIGVGWHTAMIVNLGKKGDGSDYKEIDEDTTLFLGQSMSKHTKKDYPNQCTLYLYRYRYNETQYPGKTVRATVKKQINEFFYEPGVLHVYDSYKSKATHKYRKIPKGAEILVLPEINNLSGYAYICYDGICGYVKVGKKPESYFDYGTGVKIDKSNFRDENFLKYIQKAGFDKDKDGFLSEDEINQVTEIDCKKKDIKDLKGIEHFTSLTTLDCSQNKLENLDLSNNTALERLDCSNNKLTKLDISKNNSLVSLLCGFNKLTKLDVKQKVKLKSLNCRVNDLTELDVSKNTKLQGLECDNNKLTKLDVSKNTALVILLCFNNQLSKLDVSKNTALAILLCFNNQLSNLNVKKNTALSDLSCGGNQLTKLDVSNNVKLTNLAFYNNRIKEIDVSNNTKLIKLNCDSNQLKNLDVSKNKQLSNLMCDWNHLDKLDISKNTLLEYLSCEVNQLKELNVSKNTKLYYLDCAANQIKKLDVGKLAQLQFLFCSDNRLTSLTLGKKDKLDTLYCYRNNLKSLNISKCPKILNLIKKGKKTERDGIISYTIGDSSFKFDSSVEIANKVKQKKKN